MEAILHDFNGGANDGRSPSAAVIYHDGKLYGTTSNGGTFDFGTLYSYDLTSGLLTVLHSFGANGSDGSLPNAAVIYQGGILYGTTTYGGVENNNGILFSYDLITSDYTILYSFTGGADGSHCNAPVIYQSGILYGTTTDGGGDDVGILFAFDLGSGLIATLHSFGGGSEGANSYASVIYQGGILYGTTSLGGSNNGGTLFSYDLDSGTFTTLHSFTGTGIDGLVPYASVIYQNGILYGTTRVGGDNNLGVLFSYDLATNTYETFFYFDGLNGSYPISPFLYLGGTLYGTCSSGSGDNTNGTLFSYDLSSNTFTILHSFTGSEGDGAYPNTSVIHQDGILYGITGYGGGNDTGSLFSYILPIIPISGVCFPAGTPISCDQGNIPIEKINPLKHTVNNQTITAITRTISQDNYLICFDQHALAHNCPNQRTIVSKNHKILYRGKMMEAHKFLGHSKQVRKVKYSQQILYNVLMEKHDLIHVNNIVCETLHPNNIVARLHNSHLKQKEKNEIIRSMNESIHKKDRNSFARVARLINP